MKFEEDFFAVGPSHIINPQLKLQVRLIKFYGDGVSLQIVAYCYPELRAEFITPPTMSEPATNERQNQKNLAAILETEQVPVALGILLVDAEIRDKNLNLNIDLDVDSASFLRKGIEGNSILGSTVDPIELLFSILKCIVLQENIISRLVPRAKLTPIDSINSLIGSDLAYEFFSKDESDFPEFEPGWVRIASRRCRQSKSTF